MATEKEWVESVLQPRLAVELEKCHAGEWRVAIASGKKLTYAYEILRYGSDGPDQKRGAEYQTDLLIYDHRQGGDWVPRVVVECRKAG